ncbi:hypothetical protein ACLMJK_004824 [Lecanora helva]
MLLLLPQELVEHVALYLDIASLCRLRLTHGDLNAKIFRSWAEQFHTIKTDLTPQSVRKLLAIGRHERLRDHVKGLFLQADWCGEFGRGLDWYVDQHSPSQECRTSDQFKALQDSLRHRLQKCRSFHIGGDPHNAEDADLPTSSEVALLFLKTVAETGIEIQSFTVDFIGEHPSSTSHGGGWLYGSLHKDYNAVCSLPSFSHSWCHLQELHLHLDIRFTDFDWTSNMLLEAPKIRRLSLKFQEGELTLVSKILGLVAPQLEVLNLGFVHMTPQMLFHFLRNSHMSLRRLRMRSMFLEYSLNDEEGELADWLYFFRTLRTKFHNLNAFELLNGYFALRTPESYQRVAFPSLLDNDEVGAYERPSERFTLRRRKAWKRTNGENMVKVPTVRGTSYEGSYMTDALKRLEETAEYSP